MTSMSETINAATTTISPDRVSEAVVEDASSSARTADVGLPSTDTMKQSRRPGDVALKQQRLKSWQPLLSPRWVIASYFAIALIFIPVGVLVRNKSNDLIEIKTIYESHLPNGPAADITGCEIGNSPNKMYLNNETCKIVMKVPDDKGDLEPPILVHYELFNFYQNYRKYYTSKDQKQLVGSLTQDPVSANDCEPLNKIGNITINPCGLIANTLFNDVITLESIVGPDGVKIENAPMIETGIAWESDKEWKFRQPEGFTSEQCSSCATCDCEQLNEDGEKMWSCKVPYFDEDGNCFRYFYPNDTTTQYLYETYPMVVSPLDGVMNEHFIVWMRTAALPHFRKLYGYIQETIPAGSTLTFRVMANFAVERNLGAKALVVSNTFAFGGKNPWLGDLFIAVGGIAAAFAVFFSAKEVMSPRRIADARYLRFKED
ncbi:hypothetical protein ACHAW6_011875 [Cyclotella cf. meneghiniana]